MRIDHTDIKIKIDRMQVETAIDANVDTHAHRCSSSSRKMYVYGR